MSARVASIASTRRFFHTVRRPVLHVLRLLRAGRVMRFFTRMPSLRKIILALYASIPAMLNAMLLTGIVMCM